MNPTSDNPTPRIEKPLTTSSIEDVEAATPPEPAVLPPGSKVVLYIEDTMSNLRLMGLIVRRREAIRLLSAATGLQGVALAFEHKPELILLDLNLPDINGEEVMKRLRADPRTAGIPVVIVSGDADETQIRRLLESGAKDYVTKPFDVLKFLGVLDGILGTRP